MDCAGYCKSGDCLDDCITAGQLSKPVPFIGLYVAIASLLCCLLVLADFLLGCLRLYVFKMWMPNKYFTMNAATLTLLSVAMKLPSDLTTRIRSREEMKVKYIGLIMLSQAIALFIPSLGSMSGRSIWQNMIALSILVFTVSADIIIQMFTSRGHKLLPSILLSFLFSEFVLLIHSAVTIGGIKKRLEREYDERNKQLLIKFVGLELKERLQTEELKKYIKYYWVMAITGSPSFVISRLVICSAAENLFFCCILILPFLMPLFKVDNPTSILMSDYQWSTKLILGVQMSFMFVAGLFLNIRSADNLDRWHHKSVGHQWRFTFQIEEYWGASMKAWKQRPLGWNIKYRRFRKIIQNLKIKFIEICIPVIIIIVFGSKFGILIRYHFLQLLFWIMSFLLDLCFGVNVSVEDSGNVSVEDLEPYILLLEGELRLSKLVLTQIWTSLDKMTLIKARTGILKYNGRLLNLLSEKDSFNLKNLVDFDDIAEVVTHSKKPPRSWSLSITSLTCIVVALPTIDLQEKRKLVNSVGEGLTYVRLVEKALDTNKRLGNSGKAAEVVWNGVDLKNKWLDFDLQGNELNDKDTKQVLSYLVTISRTAFEEFCQLENRTQIRSLDNPLSWPEEIIAANSLNRVSETMLQHYDNVVSSNMPPDEAVFKKTVAMICDIFVACLVNLPSVIMGKCFVSSIEKRDENVREAAELLKETEDILKFLEGHVNIPTFVSSEDAAYIDNWRALIDDQNAVFPTVQSNVQNAVVSTVQSNGQNTAIFTAQSNGRPALRRCASTVQSNGRPTLTRCASI